jgi:phosphoadenosine phosphosulfate reductase
MDATSWPSGPDAYPTAGPELLRRTILSRRGRIAVVSSFGAESAVLLALVAEIDPATTVLFLDTGRHFATTLAYRETLTARLGLRDVRSVAPSPERLAAQDPRRDLNETDPDACCTLRKVVPLAAALAEFDIWVTGRKRHQTQARADLPFIEQVDGRTKLNPLADWTEADISSAFRVRDLPIHPLLTRGFRSIGCAPCTRPVHAGEDGRAGRWSGEGKTECGIHRYRPVAEACAPA